MKFWEQLKQSISGDNNKQYVANTVNVYESLAKEEELEQSIVSSIFQYVIENCKKNQQTPKAMPEKVLKIKKKISINFKTIGDKEEITEFCRLASDKIALIEKVFSELDADDQNDIHSYILSKYFKNKHLKMTNIDNFYALCDDFIPIKQKGNPKVEHIAKSFVLFFFQDCTIFEKTQEEIYMSAQQLKLDF